MVPEILPPLTTAVDDAWAIVRWLMAVGVGLVAWGFRISLADLQRQIDQLRASKEEEHARLEAGIERRHAELREDLRGIRRVVDKVDGRYPD